MKLDNDLQDFYRRSEAYAFHLAAKWDEEWFSHFQRNANTIKGHLPSGGTVLDLGCGGGQTTFLIGEFAYSAVGVDISLKFLKPARLRPNISFISADVHILLFQNASFDVVASHAMLEHICEAKSALAEALRVLGPRGALVIYGPNMLSPFRALGVLGRRILRQKPHPDGTLSYLLRTVSLCAVKTCGFHRKFVYRCPVLNCEKLLGSDYDAVFLVNPFDLIRLTKDNGLAVISTSAGGSGRLGKLIAQLLPNLAGGIRFVAKKTL